MQKEEYQEEGQQQEEETLQSAGVMDKYKEASKISNKVLSGLIAKCLVDSDIMSLCEWSDSELLSQLSNVYNKKKEEKGIAFPTCISVNEVCGHFSPLEKGHKLKEGDVCKIDLGVHIDGYVGLVAHTIVIGKSSAKANDTVMAAYHALQAAIRLLKPGHTNQEVTSLIQLVADQYNVQPLEGVLSHEVKKHLIDGNKCIINKETFDHKVDTFQFQQNEVYVLDVIFSSGEGKPRESELRTTVYKRALERMYNLKGKSARAFFNELIEKYPSMCFSLNGFSDQITAKMGVKECLEHGLLVPYPVMTEKSGEIVAHFKSTIMIGTATTSVLSGLPVDAALFPTDKKIKEQSVLDLLALSMDKDQQKKQKKILKA